MIKAVVSISLFLGVLLFAKWLMLGNEQAPLDLNLQASQDLTQPRVEKTLSRDGIQRLVNSSGLTPEQAKIFHAHLPRSLADSPPPSRLDVDEQGQLIINMKVKRLFEFYLSAMGEDTLAECILRIRHELSNQLQGASLETALTILEGFLQYQNNIGEIKNDFVARYSQDAYSLQRVGEMKQAVRQSRDLFLSPQTVKAFYQEEDEYDDYMLKKVAIKSDRSLTRQQRQTRYDLLDAQSPLWISQQDRQATLVSRVQAQEKIIRDNGGDEYAIQVLREQSYGEETANRLALLDTQRKQWAQRVSQYQAESQSIISNDAYTEIEQEQLLADVRRQHFSGNELIRIKALDKIARHVKEN